MNSELSNINILGLIMSYPSKWLISPTRQFSWGKWWTWWTNIAGWLYFWLNLRVPYLGNLKPPAADLPISFFLIFIEKKSYLKLLFLGMRMFFVEWVEVSSRGRDVPSYADVMVPRLNIGKGLKDLERSWKVRFGSVSKPCTPGEHQNSW